MNSEQYAKQHTRIRIPVSVCRYRKSASEPAEWVIALTPRTEQARARKEQVDADSRETRVYCTDCREPLGAQHRPTCHRSGIVTSESDYRDSAHPKATGTDGPLPVPALKPRPVSRRDAQTPSGRVSYRVALRDITEAVTSLLRKSGEQWNDQAKQDLISTAFISAAKTGSIIFDFPPPEAK